MKLSTITKNALNRFLGVANLRVETLSQARADEAHFAQLASKGHFEKPVFPVPECFKVADVSGILGVLPGFQARFDSFRDPARNDVGFCLTNDYFGSPDVEVLYAIIRSRKPARIIEVGSGNSTKVARQAIRDEQLGTQLVSIDPYPRTEIDSLADRCLRQPVEQLDPAFFDVLGDGDILFIDSSHEISIGNDGSFLYSDVLPRLKSGVIVQIHDIFLPYEYPTHLIAVGAGNWNEQHLVQALLTFGNSFRVLWPGRYFQSISSNFADHFPHSVGGLAQSLWLQKTSSPIL